MQRTPTCEHCQNNYELKDFRPVGPKIPLLLPCGHTFCEGCLIKVAKLKSEINCFSCEKPVLLEPNGESGIKNITPNIYLLGLLLYNRRIAIESGRSPGGSVSAFNGIGNFLRQNNLRKPVFSDLEDITQPSEEPICDECSRRLATCQCKNCTGYKFCDECFAQVHKASKTLNKHTPLPLDCPRYEDQSCKIHHGRALQFYDKNLNEYICPQCVILEKHKQHDIIPIPELADESMHELENKVEEAKTILKWYNYSSQVLFEQFPEEMNQTNLLFSQIQDQFNAFHTLLQKRQLDLMKDASEKSLRDGSITDMLENLSKQMKLLSAALKDYELAKNDKHVLLMKSLKLMETFEKFTESPCVIQLWPEKNVMSRFSVDENTITAIGTFGRIEEMNESRFVLRKITEIPGEEQDLLLKQVNRKEVIQQDLIKANEILSEENLLNLKTPTRLSFYSGTYERVFVTHVKDPLNFNIQRISDKDRLQVMMDSLNTYCKREDNPNHYVFKIDKGQYVCAQFLGDNHWYRARIVSTWDPSFPHMSPTWQNGLKVEVLYVDYGNSERLSLSRLRLIKSEFLDVPEMSLSCSLIDIVPTAKEMNWPEQSIRAFNSLTGDRPMLMNIHQRKNGKLYVDLRKPPDDTSQIDDDRPISVRDAMVFLEVAVFFSSASNPNAIVHQSIRQYKEAPPLETNKFIDVVVTHIEDPHNLFIQKLDSTITQEQRRLTTTYAGRNRKAWKIDWPYKNLICAANYSGDRSWYRAIVKHVHSNARVDVEYVDYGNSETVPFEDIKKIPNMYLELPKQCWKVKLDQVGFVEGASTWSTACISTLTKTLLNKEFVAVAKDMNENDTASVELYDTSTSEDINMNKLFISKGLVGGLLKSNTSTEQLDVTTPVNPVSENMFQVPPLSPTLPCYLPAKLPSQGPFTATGLHIGDDQTIYLHVRDDNDDKLTDIMTQLNSEGGISSSPPTTTDQLFIGEACVGKFSQDELWYRVKISEVLSHKTVMIEFVDFGNTEEVNVDELRLEAKTIDVPCQCISVRLAGITPGRDVAECLKMNEILTNTIVGENVKVRIVNDGIMLPPYEAYIEMKDGTDVADLMISNDVGARRYGHERDNDCGGSNLPPADSVNSQLGVQFMHNSSYLWYTQQTLPNIGVFFDVQVTQVNQPDLIFIQRYPPDGGDGEMFADDSCDDTAANAYKELELLDEISQIINSDDYIANQPLRTPPVVGMACVGKYTDDDLYYRAKVEKVNEADKTVEVVFVDYGNSEILPIRSLKTLRADLVDLPMQACQVSIAGIRPTAISGQKMWSLEQKKSFFQIVANKRLIAQIVAFTDNNVSIHLYDRCSTKDSETGVTKDILIGQMLSDRKIAAFQLTKVELMFAKSYA